MMPRPQRGVVPLLGLAVVVALISFGFARGVWSSNVHNSLLALAFSAVGAYVSTQRPGHRVGLLFVATGAVEGLVFFGRQVGHAPTTSADRWWGWLGVWPIAPASALTTLAVLCFPDGRLPTRHWRWVAMAIVAIAAACAAMSAIWPVEYASVGVATVHPFHARAPALASDVWRSVAHPFYIACQILWIVAVASRWRSADRTVRSQLGVLLLAAGFSLAALAIGLIGFRTHVPGVLAAASLPVAAGWAIVHSRQVVAYRALSWLSRTSPDSEDLPSEMARTAAEALAAPTATLWMGDPDDLHAVGTWPSTDAVIAATTLHGLRAKRGRVTPIVRDGRQIGAVSVETDELTRAEARLLDDLAGQAGWVIEHLTLARVVNARRQAGLLDAFTAREREVLELMARGLTNRAICDELFLSIKTVEPIVSAIFTKLDLHADAANNRRVLAVLAYLRQSQATADERAVRPGL